MSRWIAFASLGTLLLTTSLAAQAKRPLDHDAYEIWNYIEDEVISADGRWIAYAVTVLQGDGTLEVTSADGRTTHSVPRGRAPRFSADGMYVILRITPEHELVEAARKDDESPPPDSLGIIALGQQGVQRIPDVKTYQVPADGGTWIAYHLEVSDTSDDHADDDAGDESNDVGAPLVIRDLPSGATRRVENVTEFKFATSGTRLIHAVRAPDGNGDGVYLIEPGQDESVTLLSGMGTHKQLAISEDGREAAFLSNHADRDADQPSFGLYRWRAGDSAARSVVATGHAALPVGWWVSEHGAVSFSKSANRLFFGSAPRPEAATDEDATGGVTLDVWHWQDPYLQPQLLLEAEEDRKRTYLAVVHADDGDVVQLAREDMPSVEIPDDGDAVVGIANTNMRYRVQTQWDFPRYRDAYVVDVTTGRRTIIAEELQDDAVLSPDQRFVSWWNRSAQAWFVSDRTSGTRVKVSAAIPVPVFDEEHDWPYPADAYGSVWTEDDEALLVYDRYDMWAVDPLGQETPENVTNGVGRERGIQFRFADVDAERDAAPASGDLLLQAMHLETRDAGFYRDRLRGNAPPEKLVLSRHVYSAPVKAEDADLLLYTRENFLEFPNLWLSTELLSSPRQVTDVNPQQSEYRWGTAELVEWTSTDGVPLQGVLYKPDDFDPQKKYPMMVYFYEKNSETLHRHYQPEPHRSVINRTFYASRGYLVFVPDIVYRIGYPGESAMNAVVPGVLHLMAQGFVDEDNIGVQGHSWGGYQIAYMVTQTNIFKAAEAGAPVANMTSAYGGIRWGSGMSRQWQYERSQSRLGGSLWETPMRYIENSPLFWADKVETPLLMMHNDHDGAVPWYQGIEFFTALRRLGKPTWLINYNDEPHWPTTYVNKKDWNIRMQQFFDHYLRNAPPPVWLAKGIPATKKGRTLGYELIAEPSATSNTSEPER